MSNLKALKKEQGKHQVAGVGGLHRNLPKRKLCQPSFLFISEDLDAETATHRAP